MTNDYRLLTMIKTLTLTNFRNHASGRINIRGAKNVIITGPNGAGKTAIIEGVSMLGGDRGLRGAPWTDIARFGAPGFAVFATLDDDTEIGISWNAGDSNRRARIDGDAAALSGLAARLRIVWLTPREDRLFIDSVSDRRAFFDRLVATFDATHAGRVARLGRLLSERGFALKNVADDNWMTAIETQIAGTSVAVAAARIKYAGELNYFLENISVSVSGQIESMLLNGDAMAAEKDYLQYLSQNRFLTGGNQIIDGAHKSDFGVFNKKLNLPAGITSTGQQKSAIVDLICAHAKLIRAKTGQVPIILLDEAAAHLDADTRKNMFAELKSADAMVWATGIDREIFNDIEDAIFINCVNGLMTID